MNTENRKHSLFGKDRNIGRKEPDLSRKNRRKFPLGPVRTLLTLLAVCLLGLSLSYYPAWYLGHQFTAPLIYISAFFLTFMILSDISAIRDYLKAKKQASEESTLGKTKE